MPVVPLTETAIVVVNNIECRPPLIDGEIGIHPPRHVIQPGQTHEDAISGDRDVAQITLHLTVNPAVTLFESLHFGLDLGDALDQ